MPKDNPKGYSSMMNSMKMHQSDLQAPESVYSQGFDNKTLSVVERSDKIRAKEAKNIRAQEHKGRYS